MSAADQQALEQKIQEGLEKEKEHKKNERKKRIKREKDEFSNGFRKFVTRGDVVELAVALAISAAFNKIVTGVVEFIITPLIAIITSGIKMSDWKYVLAEETAEKAEIALKYGSLIEVTIDFFLIALMLYLFISVVNRIRRRIRKAEIEKRAAEDAKRAEEAKRAAEEQAAAAQARMEQEQAFYADIREQRELLAEIRDEIKRLQTEKGSAQS